MSPPVHLTFPRGATLFGELTDWLHGRVLPDGTFCASVPPGLYAYKARLADAWVEPRGRTRSVGGVRNEVLVVGGAEEPLLFAPGAPCVSEDLDGTLRVFVGLRRGHGERVRLRYREDPGDPFVAVDCAPFVDEDEHEILLAVLHTEDFPLLRNSQRGMGSADAGDMLLGRNEVANHVFRRETQKLLAQ